MRLRKAPRALPNSPVEYPSQSFLKTEKGYFYVVDSTKRYRLLSTRVLDSWAPQRVIETTEAAVANYRIAAKLKFRNGSLIWNIADGKIYLIESGKRRWVQSPDAFTRIGVKFKNNSPQGVIVVSQDEINLHEEGEPLK